VGHRLLASRWLSAAWPGIVITALAFLVRLLTPGAGSANAVGGEAGRVILAFTAMALTVVAVAAVAARLAPDASSEWPNVAATVIGVLLGSAVMLAILDRTGVAPWNTSPRLLLTCALILATLALRAIGGRTLNHWQHASLVNDQLDVTLGQESRLNELLLATQQDRFENYAQVIDTQVQHPLDRISGRQAQMTNTQLADELNVFLTDVMRPLAHLLHPVAVRAGIIPALRSLDPTFVIHANPDVTRDDADGVLLDEHVRLQTYRWLRHLEPTDAKVDITLARDRDQLNIQAVGIAASRPLDAIQRVAGLRLGSNGLLHAPLRGIEQPIELHSDSVPPHSNRPQGHRLPTLTTAPVVSVALTVIIALATLPAQAYIARVRIGVPAVGAVLLSALVPIALVIILRAIPVPTRQVQATWWTITCWSAVGLSSGIAFVVAQQVFTQTTLSSAVIASLMLRSIVRYSVGGLLFQLARGYAAQAEADTVRLRTSIEAQQSERTRLLEEADATDRMISEGLHRTIQGRLSAVVLLLRLERRSEAITELEGVRTVTLPILLDRLRNPGLSAVADTTHTPVELLGIELIDQVNWSTIDMSPPDLVSDLKRVIDECLINAQRHGHASQMVVSATVAGSQLTMICADNGHRTTTFQGAGLGSQIFDEVSGRYGGTWTLSRTFHGTELNLTIYSS